MFSALFSRPKNPEERKIRAWCRQYLGLTPGDLALYRQALRHSSAVPEDRPDHQPKNKLLERRHLQITEWLFRSPTIGMGSKQVAAKRGVGGGQ